MHCDEQSSGDSMNTVPDVEIVIVSGDLGWEGWYVNGELVFEDTYITPGETLETLRRLYPDGFRITKVKEVEYATGWFYRKDSCNLPQKLEDVVVKKRGRSCDPRPAPESDCGGQSHSGSRDP